METRAASKRKASFETTGVITRNQRQKLEANGATALERVNVPKPTKNRQRKLTKKDAATSNKSIVSEPTKNKITNTVLQRPTNYLDLLPDVALRVLYKHLPVQDLLNARLVNPRMKEVAAEKSTWKDKVLNISALKIGDVDKYVGIIHQCPQLRGISFLANGATYYYIFFQNRVVKEIVKVVKDLRYLYAYNISFENFYMLFENFENLEKVEVGVYIYEIPKLLEALRSCSKLRELTLNYAPLRLCMSIATDQGYHSPLWKEKVTRCLTHSLPLLTSIDLAALQRGLEAEDMVHILERRKDHLLNLKLILNDTELLPVIDLISSWTRLNLDLIVTEHLTFNVDQLKLLKSIKLKMTVAKEKVPELNTIFSGIPLPNVKVLRIFPLFNRGDVTKEGFLRKLIIKFPKLQELELVGSSCKDIDEQLSDIGNLTDLESLKLRNLRFLTCRGFSHLTQCKSLKELHLLNIRLNKPAVENISKFIKLERLTIRGILSKKTRHYMKVLCCEKNITLELKVTKSLYN